MGERLEREFTVALSRYDQEKAELVEYMTELSDYELLRLAGGLIRLCDESEPGSFERLMSRICRVGFSTILIGVLDCMEARDTEHTEGV